MFGIYRYCLALCVAISHLWAGMIGGPAAYAVWGFYCLSGFLMTLVLNEKYGYAPKGILAFARNRGLRIYPAYYAVCVLMLAVYLLVPETAATFHPTLHMPQTNSGWLFSLTLLTPSFDGLVQGSSALRVELWMYIVIALGFSRNFTTTAIWFTACAVNTWWLVKTGVRFEERYVFIVPCALAFSVGSLLYHVKRYLPTLSNPWWAVGAAAFWWAHVWFSQHIPGGPWVYGLYSSLIVSCVVMVTLMNLKPRYLPQWLSKTDKLLGDLSYPIYLCHWAVGVLVTLCIPSLTRNDFEVFAIGFPIVNVLAFLIYRYVEAPIAQLKTTQRSQPDAAPIELHEERKIPRVASKAPVSL